MDASLNTYLRYELTLLKNCKETYLRRLKQCDGAENVLMHESRKQNGKRYFYTKRKGTDGYKYAGRKNSDAVSLIREAHFLREAIRRVDSNIDLIQSFMGAFIPYDHYSVNDSLPAVYRSDIAPVSKAYEKESVLWKARRLDFQAAFPENYPAHKTEQTSDGVMVKTISEVVLYERIKSAGLCAIYELPLVLNDYGPPMYPDLTVLSPVDLKTEIIIEYVGRLDIQKYRDDFARKVGRYIANGYTPGVNLFFVFGDKDGHIDSTQLNRIIADILGI